MDAIFHVNGGVRHCGWAGCKKPLQRRCYYCETDGKLYCEASCAERELERISTHARRIN